MFGDGVAGEEAAERGGVMAVVVVNEVEFGVVVFRAETERVEGDDVEGGGYNYLLIKNDEENYSKNNILLMEIMAINKTSGKLQILDGVVYDSQGIVISKAVLEAQQKIFGGEIATIFVKYTTISKATVDTVAKILVSAIRIDQKLKLILLIV